MNENENNDVFDILGDVPTGHAEIFDGDRFPLENFRREGEVLGSTGVPSEVPETNPIMNQGDSEIQQDARMSRSTPGEARSAAGSRDTNVVRRDKHSILACDSSQDRMAVDDGEEVIPPFCTKPRRRQTLSNRSTSLELQDLQLDLLAKSNLASESRVESSDDLWTCEEENTNTQIQEGFPTGGEDEDSVMRTPSTRSPTSPRSPLPLRNLTPPPNGEQLSSLSSSTPTSSSLVFSCSMSSSSSTASSASDSTISHSRPTHQTVVNEATQLIHQPSSKEMFEISRQISQESEEEEGRILRSSIKRQRESLTTPRKSATLEKEQREEDSKDDDSGRTYHDGRRLKTSKMPTDSALVLQHDGVLVQESYQMGPANAEDDVQYTHYTISGFCTTCAHLKEVWEDGITNGIQLIHMQEFLRWIQDMYLSQIKEIGTVFPRVPSVSMKRPTKLDWMEPFSVMDKRAVSNWQDEYKQWVSTASHKAIIWTCYDQSFNMAVIRVVKTKIHRPQMHIVVSNQSTTLLNNIKQMLLDSELSQKVAVTEESPSEWGEGAKGFFYWVGVVEEMARTSSYATKFNMRQIIEKRLAYAFSVICEHRQRLWRNGENQYATGRKAVQEGDKPSDKVINTLSNVLGIGQSFEKIEIVIKPHGSTRKKEWEKIVPGEKGRDKQQLWVGGDKFGTNLLHMAGESIEEVAGVVWAAYKKKMSYNSSYSRGGRKKEEPDIVTAPAGSTPMSDKDLLKQLNRATLPWKHNWEQPQPHPYKYAESEFEQLFQDTGFAVIQFASGEELEEMRRRTIEQARKAWKMAIVNDLEIPVQVRGQRGQETEWEVVARDVARFQTPLSDEEEMPGTDAILKHYPKTPVRRGNKSSFMPVKVMYKNRMYSHKGCMAQNVHWDMEPEMENRIDILLGSALVALWETRLIIYPMSHEWAQCEYKLRRPITIVLPAGSILFFSTLAHAGYGVWSIDEAVFRPCPSFDDLMEIKMIDLLIRYQAHIARPRSYDKNHKSINPTKTVRIGLYPKLASYLYVDRKVEPKVYYPPVFAMEGGDTTIALEYGQPVPHVGTLTTTTSSDESKVDEHKMQVEQKLEDNVEVQTEDNDAHSRSTTSDQNSLKRQRISGEIVERTHVYQLEADIHMSDTIREEDMTRVSVRYERRRQDIDMFLGTHNHLQTWFEWLESLLPSIYGWRNRIHSALDIAIEQGSSMSEFASHMTSSVAGMRQEFVFPSLQAWCLVTQQEEFITLEFEKIVRKQCARNQQIYIVLLARYGRDLFKVLVVKKLEGVQIYTSTTSGDVEDLKCWIDNRVKGRDIDEVSEFRVTLVAAWKEDTQAAMVQ